MIPFLRVGYRMITGTSMAICCRQISTIKNISYKAFHDGSTLIFYYCGLKKPLALPAFPYTFVKTLTNCLYAQVRNDLLHKR
jgi:hypothetical protein